MPEEQLKAELAARAVGPKAAARRGQLGIADAATFLLSSEPAVADLVETLGEELERAHLDGYDGIRVSADMAWATRPAGPADRLSEVEAQIHDLFAAGRLCVVCQYDRERFDPVTLAFAAATHSKAVAAQVYHDGVLLRICRQYSPPGVRIAGELDFRHRDELERALGESRRLDRHMHLNLRELHYIDAACAGVIVQTASSLPASRRMTVTCQSLVARVLGLVGVSGIAQIRVLGGHDGP